MKYLGYDSWVQRYGEDVADQLHAWFNEDDGYECMDNLRVARVGIFAEERAYENQKSEGCCGIYDEESEIEGQKDLVGFNYGH